MKLRKCNQLDLIELIEIGRSTYYETFHTMNSNETMSKYLDEAFHPTKINEELHNPDSSFYFLYSKEILSGYIKINFSPSQTDINDRNSLELERIYVKKEHIGKGFGKFLINKTISIAKNHKLKYVWLGVWEENKPALAFYRKMGFEFYKKHTFRMGDELQNDFILRRNI